VPLPIYFCFIFKLYVQHLCLIINYCYPKQECPAGYQEEKKYSTVNATLVSYFECVPCKGDYKIDRKRFFYLSFIRSFVFCFCFFLFLFFCGVSLFKFVTGSGPCPKICKGAFLNNIETVQKLRDCTAIDGDLEMQIKGGGSIIQELERSLGNIEEIRGKLKIVRCFPLLSLNFLKSLKTITGLASRPELSGDSKDPEDE
jgi:hypothetical protein